MSAIISKRMISYFIMNIIPNRYLDSELFLHFFDIVCISVMCECTILVFDTSFMMCVGQKSHSAMIYLEPTHSIKSLWPYGIPADFSSAFNIWARIVSLLNASKKESKDILPSGVCMTNDFSDPAACQL